MQVPKGYNIIYGGQYENLERAGKQLALTIPLTIVMVFLFLFMLFKNLSHTLVTMSCILFALAGGIVALFNKRILFQCFGRGWFCEHIRDFRNGGGFAGFGVEPGSRNGRR